MMIYKITIILMYITCKILSMQGNGIKREPWGSKMYD